MCGREEFPAEGSSRAIIVNCECVIKVKMETPGFGSCQDHGVSTVRCLNLFDLAKLIVTDSVELGQERDYVLELDRITQILGIQGIHITGPINTI